MFKGGVRLGYIELGVCNVAIPPVSVRTGRRVPVGDAEEG